MESLFCGMVDDLPEGRQIERPLHPKKARVLPSASRPAPSGYVESGESAASTPHSRTPHLGTPRSGTPHSRTPRSGTPYSRTPRSGTPYSRTPRSGTPYSRTPRSVTPRSGTPRSGTPRSGTPRSGTPRSGTSLAQAGRATKRPASPQAPAKAKRRLDMTSSSPSTAGERPLRDNENVLCYGSEEDSAEEDEDGDAMSIPVPRGARLFLQDEDEDGAQGSNAALCFQWPPRPEPQPEWSSEPEPMPEVCLQPKPEPEPTPEAELTLHEPVSKFDFKWEAFPQSQIEPQLRRETFSNINCGPTVPLANPYEAFTAIWSRDIMEHIAMETNRYAQQLITVMQKDGTMRPRSRITKWRDTDASELYVYFAIILATGILVKSRLEEYWNSSQDIFSTPGFTATMRYDRFHLLCKCLHFANNDCCNPELMTRSEAKLFKVKPIVDHLNNKFPQLYNMSQNVALDESLTMWKGWLEINQFIHNKAATVGIKTYEVCESQTGYLWRFEVHAGHDTSSQAQTDSPVSGIIPALVFRLLDGLEDKGHTIWMDNFYNSPALARELKVRGFDCVGTLRTNRQLVPAEMAKLTKADNMAVGQVYGCTSGDVDLILWRDKNRVALISTYHGLAAVKCGDTQKPSIVPDYNLCMGGVDRKDQMLAMYPIERRRNRIWYKKFFRRLLNTSVLNAYILLKSQHPIDHRQFRKTLVNQLITQHIPSLDVVAPPEPVGHFPGQYDFINNKQRERLRRLCVVCKNRVSTYCKMCNVSLCLFTCFELHHTLQ